MDPQALGELAQEWLRIDKDPETHAEIEQLLLSEDHHELGKRVGKRITFGTAGLRARMEAGFSRMNSVTVIQASQGLAEYLISLDPYNREKGVVIGRDGRHNSEKFAKLTASTFLKKGFKVYYLRTVHTPLVPYAISHHGAAVGVMVTASHNPPQDNGYKVYLGNGCQIVSPHDKGIADKIDANLEPETWEIEHINYENPLVIDGFKVIGGKYLQAVKHKTWIAQVPELQKRHSRSIKFTYTPMHGVGWYYFRAVLEIMKLDRDMHVVRCQAHRNADFPTVKFPNPEEKGALDEAIKTADTFGDDLILANDPDADRFAAAQRVDGVWKQFTGNQMGVLLASFVWDMHSRTGPAQRDIEQPTAMFVSAVSSRMLFKMAENWPLSNDDKITVEETLTGFKWLGNRAQTWEQETGGKALFAYEEAIGYMIPQVVYDKDGVAAASLFLAACYYWQQEDMTPWDRLQELYEAYGFFEDANTYLITPSPAVTEQVFAQIRAARPSTVGARKIKRWRDLTLGHDTGSPDNVPNLPVDSSAQMITCWLDDDVVFTTRGSGTEPKLKLYIEASSGSSERAKEIATSVLEDLMREWFKPEEYGLIRA